jgi:hypothetical protein
MFPPKKLPTSRQPHQVKLIDMHGLSDSARKKEKKKEFVW